MSNASRAKGTGWEVELLPHLRILFYPDLPITDKLPNGDDHPLQRAPLKGVHDYGDFTGLPGGLLIEAKKTDAPHFKEWAKNCAKKTAGLAPWVVVWSGDRRKGDGPFVLMSLPYYLQLEDLANNGEGA